MGKRVMERDVWLNCSIWDSFCPFMDMLRDFNNCKYMFTIWHKSCVSIIQNTYAGGLS